MSVTSSKNNHIKKLQDQYSQKHSETDQQQTQFQTSQHLTKKSKKKQLKAQNKIKIKKKQQEKYNSQKFQQPYQLKSLKNYQDDEKDQDLKPKYYQGLKSIKDNADEEQLEESKEAKPRRKRNLHNRKKESDEKNEQMQKNANEIIELIEDSYDADVDLYKKGKPADRKLKCILEIEKKLKQVELARVFLGMNGLLSFTEWLLPNSQTKQETSLTVKIHLMNMLFDMNISKEHIVAANELEDVIKRYKKSRFDTLREMSRKILEKWRYVKAIQSR